MADSYDVEIEFLDASGSGVARIGRRQVVVPYTIPGERVRVRVGAQRGTPSIVMPDAIVRPSPHRVQPGCRHFGIDAMPGVGPCGGCSWQHIAYPEQLRLKTDLVTRLVRAAIPRAPAARPMLPATSLDAPWGYRHKVHFVFGSGGSAERGGRRSRGHARRPPLVMGHHARGSRRVIPVVECPVHDERGNAMAFRLRDEYVRAQAAAAPDGALKSLAIHVSCASPEIMGTLVVAHDADKTVRVATRRVLDGAGAPTSFHVNVHPKADAFILGPRTRRLSGHERLRQDVAGVSFLISPDAFFQTNIHAAGILVRLVAEALTAGVRVLDLYAGAGLFALPLARGGHDVVAVEENRSAVADGEASRRLSGIPAERCRFVAQPAEQALRDAVRRPHALAEFDAVVLDPPREGCSPAVIDLVFNALAPATAVYISCNPEALARDLAAVVRLPYRIQSLQPVDMFPHTAHVETVAVLARA